MKNYIFRINQPCSVIKSEGITRFHCIIVLNILVHDKISNKTLVQTIQRRQLRFIDHRLRRGTPFKV